MAKLCLHGHNLDVHRSRLSLLGRGLIVYLLCETQDSVQPFLVEPLLHVGLRPGVKGLRSRLYRVKRNE